jgi:N-succinyldiaminopimelate aminotransferase
VISRRLASFSTNIFSEMSRLAQEKGAVNLAQGFPDFNGPPEILEAAVKAVREGKNQYARSMGDGELVESIADKVFRHYKLKYEPYTEIAVVAGATEGMASAFLGLLNPGDEVIIFEPYYESYPAFAALAGAVPSYYTLRFPDFKIDIDELDRCFTPHTRLLLLNTPHNPTGKVFSREELAGIARLCEKHDVMIVTDEVYEHLTYDAAKHIPIATIPGARERTITISSMGKTFSLTGWRIGWVIGPENIVAAIQAAHQFITFAPATPLQVALAGALKKLGEDYYRKLRKDYTERRSVLMSALKTAGFTVAVPRGAYFILADFSTIWDGDDRAFVRYLIDRCSVAGIPPSVFYSKNPEEGKHLVRLAFCKQIETLSKAADLLMRLT